MESVAEPPPRPGAPTTSTSHSVAIGPLTTNTDHETHGAIGTGFAYTGFHTMNVSGMHGMAAIWADTSEPLEDQGDLIRITHPVDCYLEAGCIADKLVKNDGPAVIFEKPRLPDGTISRNSHSR